jgi:hypothetical protein
MLAAVLAAVLAAAAALSGGGLRSAAGLGVAASSASAPPTFCPPNSLPDDGVCIPVPRPGAPDDSRRAARDGTEDAVPRRPDRDPDYARYVFPVPAPVSVVPAARAPELASLGGTALRGVAVRAAPDGAVRVPRLEGQEGPASVVFEGALAGQTLVTRHAVRAGARREDVLVVLGNLADARALAPKEELGDADAVAKTRGTLYLECRLVRPGVDVATLAPERLLDDAVTVSTDVRNVLARAEPIAKSAP